MAVLKPLARWSAVLIYGVGLGIVASGLLVGLALIAGALFLVNLSE
jgi:hypothetical protein